jgi:hypothetical protein
MSCCGKSRQAVGSAVSRPNHASGVQPVPFRKTYGPAAGAVTFEYQGGGALTVTGQGTGEQYRFVGHGSRVNVDSRDRASLLVVPSLREVNR